LYLPFQIFSSDYNTRCPLFQIALPPVSKTIAGKKRLFHLEQAFFDKEQAALRSFSLI
jgi:hypothetical protein